jgi:hypothetical protein
MPKTLDDTIDRAERDVAAALRYHHATPIERIDMEIERLRPLGEFAKDRIAELHRRKAELEAAGEPVGASEPVKAA